MDQIGTWGRVLPRSTAILAIALLLGIAGSGVAAAEAPRPHDIPFVPVPGQTVGDRVHISSSLPPTASAHGWWTYSEPTSLKAIVTIQLQINRGGTWTNVGTTGSKTVYAGGGSANRANARMVCLTLESNEWRSVIDVDILGKIDTPEKLITQVRRLSCGA